MNRRGFLNLTLPATGAVLLGNALLHQEAYAEINRQFSGAAAFDTYDLVINGGGLFGYFAAIHAAKAGKKVLLVEKRSSPGYEFAAKSNLWLGAEGFGALRPDLREFFCPEQELPEVKNTKGGGHGKSAFGNEIMLFKGSIRKGMVRNVLRAGADLLLMTDVCGLFETNGQVSGALLACKQGVLAVNCKNFIDASDQLLFSRALAGESLVIGRAGFVIELNKVQQPIYKTIKAPSDWGIYRDQLVLRPGKLSGDQAFISFEYPAPTGDFDEIEHKARLLTAKIGGALRTLDKSLAKAEIYQYAGETSLIAENTAPPAIVLRGHLLAGAVPGRLKASDIPAIEKQAGAMIDGLRYPDTREEARALRLPGKEVPLKALRFRPVEEPGFAIPLRYVDADWGAVVKIKKQAQVVVAGGGTAGALAAAGAVDKGAATLVADYFNDLGGTKTMGGVMGYYHGVRENTFFKKQNEEAERLAFESNMQKRTGRKLYHLKAVIEKGGQFVTSALFCGAVAENRNLRSVLICRHGQLELLEGQVTIDATGDGDVAAFAGASFQIGDSRIGHTQNYSQWDVAGSGKLPSNTNRDYDILDNTKISEQQRGLLISHYEAHFYDFYPFLTVRESRRIDGIHNLDLIDCVEGRHFEDVLALASSDFDPHNVGSSEFTKCGFLLPHSNDITVEIPYRCIVPKATDGLLMAGRGYGQTHNALQFTRMTADLLVLGYLTGQIAADIAWKKVKPRDYQVSALQKEWAALNYLPPSCLTRKPGDKRADPDEIRNRVQKLEAGLPEYLYECSRIEKSRILPLLTARFTAIDAPEVPTAEGKLLLAKMLAWFGAADGNDLIAAETSRLYEEERRKGYPGGYIDDYDGIRGREKNKLEGHFWRINQNIALLAMSGNGSALDTVRTILEQTESGGDRIPRTSDYFNNRIDLRFVPYHNRILSLCMYAERVPDRALIPGFGKLLDDKRIGGYLTTAYKKVRWQVYGASLELSIAAALARCGGKEGYLLLTDYLSDLHYSYKHFAMTELKTLTGKDFGYDRQAWSSYLGGLAYPRTPVALRKEVEI